MDQDFSSLLGRKWPDSGYNLKEEPIGFGDVLIIGCEEREDNQSG